MLYVLGSQTRFVLVQRTSFHRRRQRPRVSAKLSEFLYMSGEGLERAMSRLELIQSTAKAASGARPQADCRHGYSLEPSDLSLLLQRSGRARSKTLRTTRGMT